MAAISNVKCTPEKELKEGLTNSGQIVNMTDDLPDIPVDPMDRIKAKLRSKLCNTCTSHWTH